MRRIKFDNAKNWFWVGILILSLILIIVGAFELFPFENPKHYRHLSLIGFLLQIVFYSKMFWYKNCIHWNKLGGVFRLNTFTSKSIKFDDFNDFEFKEQKLFYKSNGKIITFNLKDIVKEDIDKLNELLSKHITIYKTVN